MTMTSEIGVRYASYLSGQATVDKMTCALQEKGLKLMHTDVKTKFVIMRSSKYTALSIEAIFSSALTKHTCPWYPKCTGKSDLQNHIVTLQQNYDVIPQQPSKPDDSVLQILLAQLKKYTSSMQIVAPSKDDRVRFLNELIPLMEECVDLLMKSQDFLPVKFNEEVLKHLSKRLSTKSRSKRTLESTLYDLGSVRLALTSVPKGIKKVSLLEKLDLFIGKKIILYKNFLPLHLVHLLTGDDKFVEYLFRNFC